MNGLRTSWVCLADRKQRSGLERLSAGLWPWMPAAKKRQRRGINLIDRLCMREVVLDVALVLLGQLRAKSLVQRFNLLGNDGFSLFMQLLKCSRPGNPMVDGSGRLGLGYFAILAA